MPPSVESAVASREAEQGERMIEIKIRFWTDALAEAPGKIVPKHGWASGVVRAKSNKTWPAPGFVDTRLS